MRTISFREVLWETAFRMGLDPTSDLSTEHAVALGLYINSVVRQSWHATDWPEWTLTQPRTPNARHIVSYEAPAGQPSVDNDLRIGRALKVYLNDPDIVQPPLEIAHRLTSEGVHVGFEHGSQVWVKFQPPAPAYSAFSWVTGNTYPRGAVVYSPVSGECYESKSSGNFNHNPATEHVSIASGVGVDIIQEYRPDSPGFPGTTQITRIDVDFQGDIVEASKSTIAVRPSPGEEGPEWAVNYVGLSGDTVADVVNALVALLTAVPELSAFTITADTVADPPTITLEADQAFTITQAYKTRNIPLGPIADLPQVDYFPVVGIQTYSPPTPFVPGQPQVTQFKLSDVAALPGATYSLTFHDEAGQPHTLVYVNPDRNSAVDVLNGIVLELQFLKVNSDDTFWDRIQAIINPAARNIWFGIHSIFSLDVDVDAAGSPWWRWIKFPVALADVVIRGARSISMSEEGQSDKAAAEEQAAGAMAAGQVITFTPPAFNPLTDQVKPGSRYRIEGAMGGTK